MLLALVLTLISISSGFLLTYTYDKDADLATRLAQGGPLGLVGFGLFGFVCAVLIGPTPLTLLISSLCLMLIACLLAGSRTLRKVRSELSFGWARARSIVSSPRKQLICIVLAFAVMSSVMWQVFDRAMFYRGGSMYTGIANDYGDLPFHLTVITRFAYAGNLPPEDPVYSGTRFTYPYLADFITAMLVRAGAGLRGAMLLESLALALSLLWLLGKWSLELTQDRTAALISPLLVLLGSGLGFTMIFREARDTQRGLLSLIWMPIHDYTMNGEGLRWGDSLTFLLVTQRSMLLGLPMAIIIFRQWWKFSIREPVSNADSASKSAEAARTRRYIDFSKLGVDIPMLGAGVIAGFLPVCHAHTFLAVMVVAGCLAIASRKWRGWASFFVPAILIGGSQAWSISHDSAAQFKSFFALNLGWENGNENFVWFWLKNTGAFIPLIIFAVLKRGSKPLLPKQLLRYYLPFLTCFLVPNIVKLAPWTWDNMKVLFYWYLASAPLVGLVLAWLWRAGRWRRALSALLLVSLVFSGSLDVLRVITRGDSYQIFSPQQLAFAELIKQDTPLNALILHAPVPDDPVFLTGRRSFMGYPGHIWTRGIDYIPRSNDIQHIYEGGLNARDLIARYNIQYAVVSPQERNLMKVDDAFFDEFGKVAEVGEYRLYRTR
jgi:hypothetical protein